VAPYSARAKDDATVSMPIEWKSITGGISPTAFTIGGRETGKILGQPDPWKDFFKAAKPLQR
jgi:bifunctional non-homologous end joining protein LigD